MISWVVSLQLQELCGNLKILVEVVDGHVFTMSYGYQYILSVQDTNCLSCSDLAMKAAK